MTIVPAKPDNSSVPESATTVTDNCGTPRFIEPECCSTKLPCRPCRLPVTCSIATYPAEPFTGDPALSISPLLNPSRSPWNCFSIDNRPRVASASLFSSGIGLNFTSKVPVARVVTVARFRVGIGNSSCHCCTPPRFAVLAPSNAVWLHFPHTSLDHVDIIVAGKQPARSISMSNRRLCIAPTTQHRGLDDQPSGRRSSSAPEPIPLLGADESQRAVGCVHY